MMEHFARHEGVLDPDDLTFLQSVYDDLVASRQFKPEDKCELAAALLRLFKSGIRDRELLYRVALLM